ncbi:hypothetical protein Fmac_032450 [Flemingia macrophylla]|uniref:Uncharacterized protein n=1 Tax=Flemingia macrophylla TaxID=520843 RepID=A0ABD1L4Y7_9FABA
MIAKSNMERTNDLEKENSIQIIKGKNKKTGFLTSISSQITEKQAEFIHVIEAWDKIREAEILAALEIEEKKL